MAPLPVTNTRRYFLDYHTDVAAHTVMVRTTGSVDEATFSSVFGNFLTQLAPILNLITVDGLRVAVAGSNVTNPAVWSGGASYGTGTEQGFLTPRELCFLGRSSDGRRARLFVFGYKGATPVDFRIESSGSPEISNAYGILNANPGIFISISGLATVKYPYVDVNFNSYWERQRRG